MSSGSIMFSAITSMLSQVGTGQHRGQPLGAVAQRLHRVARMVEQLAAVGAVQAVVQVVPPVALAPRAPHDARHADGRRSGDEAPGLGDHADALGQLRQRCARSARRSAPMSRHRLVVVDREAAADVQRVEDAELLAPRRGDQPGARLRSPRRACSASGVWEPTWKESPARQAEHRRRGAPAAEGPPGRSRTCATGRTTAPGAAERDAQQQLAPRSLRRENFRSSSGLSATKVRTPNFRALADVLGALDRVGVDAALRDRRPVRCTSCTSPVVARSR